METAALPETSIEWLLAENELGNVVVVEVCEGDGGRVSYVQDLLRSHMFRALSDGRLLVRHTDLGMMTDRWPTEHRADHRVASLRVRFEAAAAADMLKAYVFLVRSDGCKVYFSLASVLCRSKKNASVCECHQFKTWTKAPTQIMVQDLLMSQAYGRRTGLPSDCGDRVLREKTCSSCMLVFSLARWALCPTQRGGLSSEREVVALSPLKRLFAHLHRGRGFDIPLCVGKEIRRSATGHPIGETCVIVRAGPECFVDMSVLVQARREPCHAALWCRNLAARFHSESVALLSFVEWLVRDAFPRCARRL